MGKTVKGHKIDTILVLIIFCIFAVSVLLVLMLSGRVYKNMTQVSREGYDEHIVFSFIWTKVKNEDNAGSIRVVDFDGASALCIDEKYGDTVYQTRIYLYDGWICELFSEADLDMSPEYGTPLIKTDRPLTFESLDSGLIRAVSGSRSLLISPRGKTGEGGQGQ